MDCIWRYCTIEHGVKVVNILFNLVINPPAKVMGLYGQGVKRNRQWTYANTTTHILQT